MKVAFLDRDGTIVKDYPDEDWKSRTIPEVLDGALEGMKLLNQLGYEIIIVTNQYIMNEGIITLDEYKVFTSNLEKVFVDHGIKVLEIFFCPHTDTDKCECKKPKTGMIKSALTHHPDIDLKNSILIGDSESDELLAHNMNITFFKINNGLSKSDGTYQSINAIAERILSLKQVESHVASI